MNILDIQLAEGGKEQAFVIDNMSDRDIERFKKDMANKRLAKVALDFPYGSYAVFNKTSIKSFNVERID